MAEKLCPLLQKACLEHACRWFTGIPVTDVASGEMQVKHACAVEWLPLLLIENSKQTRMTGKEVETLRNDVSSGAAGVVLQALIAAEKRKPQLEKDDESKSLPSG